MSELIKLEVVDGKVVTTSLRVAAYFGKEHFNVVRDIRSTASKCSKSFNALNFELVEYVDAKGESRPMYLLSKDGMLMVTMGYTTPKAMEVKEKYIAEFNRMEKELKTSKLALPQDYISALKALVKSEEEKQLALAEVEQKSLALESAKSALEEAAPKIEYADAVKESVNTISMNSLAKKLNAGGYPTGALRLFEWMRQKGYVMKEGRDNIPTQKSINMGIMKITQNTFPIKNQIYTSRKAVITGKGQLYFFNKLCGKKFTDVCQLPIIEEQFN